MEILNFLSPLLDMLQGEQHASFGHDHKKGTWCKILLWNTFFNQFLMSHIISSWNTFFNQFIMSHIILKPPPLRIFFECQNKPILLLAKDLGHFPHQSAQLKGIPFACGITAHILTRHYYKDLSSDSTYQRYALSLGTLVMKVSQILRIKI